MRSYPTVLVKVSYLFHDIELCHMSSFYRVLPFNDLSETELFDILNICATSLVSFGHLYLLPIVFTDADLVKDLEQLFSN